MKQKAFVIFLVFLYACNNCGNYYNPTIEDWQASKPKCARILQLYKSHSLPLRLEFGRGHYEIPDSLLLCDTCSNILAVSLGVRSDIFNGTYTACFGAQNVDVVFCNTKDVEEKAKRECWRKLEDNWYLRSKQ